MIIIATITIIIIVFMVIIINPVFSTDRIISESFQHIPQGQFNLVIIFKLFVELLQASSGMI